MPKIHSKITLAFLLLCGGLAPSAQAQFVFQNRVSSYDITFSNNDFSNASTSYQVALDAYSLSGAMTVIGYGVNLKSDHTGFSWTGSGGTTVSNIAETANFATADLASDGTFGGYVFNYNSPAETNFNNLGGSFGNTWIVRKDFGGLVGLEFQGGGTGVVDANSSFTVDVLINGDWSTPGTGPFQTEFVGLDSNWTIDKNFVLNGANTEFKAHVDTFNGHNPNLDFILHGPAAATPEPGTLALLTSLGLTGAGFLARRKRMHKGI